MLNRSREEVTRNYGKMSKGSIINWSIRSADLVDSLSRNQVCSCRSNVNTEAAKSNSMNSINEAQSWHLKVAAVPPRCSTLLAQRSEGRARRPVEGPDLVPIEEINQKDHDRVPNVEVSQEDSERVPIADVSQDSYGKRAGGQNSPLEGSVGDRTRQGGRGKGMWRCHHRSMILMTGLRKSCQLH